MNIFHAILDEIIGMFVDDGSLAIAIVVIVAVAGWVSMRFEYATAAIAILLLVGSLAALIENVVRTARNAKRSS